MNKCPFSKLKEKLSTKKSDVEVQNNPQYIVKEETKIEVKDILSYLSPKDLETVKNQNITLQEFMDFIKSIQSNDIATIKKLLNEYVKENLKDLQKLKKEVNNLHIKMFWEYLKEKVEELGEHDFIGFKDGKLVNVPITEYTGDIIKIRDKLDKENYIIYKKLSRLNNYLEKFTLLELVTKHLFKKLHRFMIFENIAYRLWLMNYDTSKSIQELYKIFINDNKYNEIIRAYKILEEIISNEIKFHSNFELIFPNTNMLYIESFIEYLYFKGKGIEIEETKKFFKDQNQENIRRALYSGSFGSQLDNRHMIELGRYDEKKGIVSIDKNTIPINYINSINSFLDEYNLHGKGDGRCPFSRTKSGTQNKNAFIEEFEFFDGYMLKIFEELFQS
ncbi:MAG: hypothetical protein Q8K30_06595 [Candidatus Gracilibacteria bacterium]|nr:hypothetical protein [Candidatus Gracilibacteria bacterium]